MDKQFIVSISREYASGGHEIAAALAEKFGVPLYDHNLLDEIAKEKGMDVEALNKYDEVPRRKLMSRTVRGFSNSPEEVVAELQFDFIREKAKSGESFVIVGRCAESVLADYDCLIPIFITADFDAKVTRIMDLRKMTREQAIETIHRHDVKRESYHDHFCETRWGDSRAYDLCINTTAITIEGATDCLSNYISHRIDHL